MSTNKDQIVSKSKLVTVKRQPLWSLAPGMTLGQRHKLGHKLTLSRCQCWGENATNRELGQVTKHSPMNDLPVIIECIFFPHHSHYLRNTFVNCPETLAGASSVTRDTTIVTLRDTGQSSNCFQICVTLAKCSFVVRSSTLCLRLPGICR